MKASLIFWFALSSLIANAADGIKCTVTVKRTKQEIPVRLERNQGEPGIPLDNGRKLEIEYFGDDIRFTVMRPPTAAEQAAFNAEHGNDEVFLAGHVVGSAATRFTGVLTSAHFDTEETGVDCK